MTLDTNPCGIIFVGANETPVEMLFAIGDVASLYDEGQLIVCRLHEINGNTYLGRVMSSDNPTKYPDDSDVIFVHANIFGVFKANARNS